MNNWVDRNRWVVVDVALMQQYEERREELLKQGIMSFSGYVTRFLYDALEQASQQTR